VNQPFDRFKSSLAAFITSVMARVDYYGLYSCSVVQQNSDGTLELKPDRTLTIAGLSKIPILYGDPATQTVVASGSRVLLGWQNGDPAKPYATLWGYLPPQKLTLNATAINLNNGTMGAAREGDSVQVMLTSVEIAGIIAPSGGGPCTGGPLTLTGQITSGSTTTEIG
jgi:hypothetical protein